MVVNFYNGPLFDKEVTYILCYYKLQSDTRIYRKQEMTRNSNYILQI